MPIFELIDFGNSYYLFVVAVDIVGLTNCADKLHQHLENLSMDIENIGTVLAEFGVDSLKIIFGWLRKQEIIVLDNFC